MQVCGAKRWGGGRGGAGKREWEPEGWVKKRRKGAEFGGGHPIWQEPGGRIMRYRARVCVRACVCACVRGVRAASGRVLPSDSSSRPARPGPARPGPLRPVQSLCRWKGEAFLALAWEREAAAIAMLQGGPRAGAAAVGLGAGRQRPS